MKTSFLISITLSFFTLVGSAQASADCSKRTRDPEVLICSEHNRAVAEKELNAEYSAAIKRIGDVFSSEPEIKNN